MQKKGPLLTLFVTILLDMLGLGILIPITPVLFADPTSPHYLLPIGTTVSTGYILLGILIALFALGQFIASPIIGQFSDKWGRKRLLIISVFGTAVGHFLFALAILFHNLPLLFFSRLFAGIMGGNIVVAQAAIADITTPENRAKNFGLIGAAFGLGFVIGPFIGGKLADPTLVSWFSATTPFFFAAILSTLNGIQVMYRMIETNQHIATDRKIDWSKSLKNISKAFTLSNVRPIFITNFLYQAGFAFYTTFAAVYLLSHFHFTEGSIGNYFAFVGVWIVITQGFVTRKIAKYYPESKVVQNSLIATGLCITAIVLAPTSLVLYLLVPVFAMAVGLSQANITALISRSAGPAIQGEVLGLNGSVMALAQTLPPLVSGIIAAHFQPHAPLLIASLLTIAAGLYFNNHLRTLRLAHS